MNFCARSKFLSDLREALGIAITASFIAWLIGLAPTLIFAAWTAFAGPSPIAGFLMLTLLIACYSGIVLAICTLAVVWPACLLALRWAPIPWGIAAMAGAGIGWLTGAVTTPPDSAFPLITSAYGAVIGAFAARTHLRWSSKPTAL